MYFIFLSRFLLFFLCCSHCLSFARDLCLLYSPLPFSVLFPSLCPHFHPRLRLKLVFLHSKCFSLSGSSSLPYPPSTSSSPDALPACPLSVYICIISRTLHPLSLLCFSFTFLSFIWAHIPLLPHSKFSLNDSKCLGPMPP